MYDHEYALLGGMNRSKIGQMLAIVSAIVSGLIVFAVLSVVDLANMLGFPVNLPPTALSLVGAGAVFTALYWLFDRYAWKWRVIGMWLKVPDLSGTWDCAGKTLGPDEQRDWVATITILQSWDRIRVRLKSSQSASNSVTAALVNDPVDGFRLIYSYRNEPRIGEPELASHSGFSTIVFDKSMTSGSGEYFNGVGRPTFGTMTLTREAK